MDPTIAALLGTGIGVVATVASTFIQTRRAKEAWWREHRMKAYADFLETVERGFRASVDPNDEELEAREPAANAMDVALARVELLGPPEVFLYANNMVRKTKESIRTDAAGEGVEEARFVSQQEFIRHSKIALSEPGIAKPPKRWNPFPRLVSQLRHRKLQKNLAA